MDIREPNAPNERPQHRDMSRLLIVGAGALANEVERDLVARGMQPVRRWEPRASSDDLRDEIDLASAAIVCADGPSTLPTDVAALSGDRRPLVAAALTARGAHLQVDQPRPVAAGCLMCAANLRESRDPIEWAAAEGLRGRSWSAAAWRYQHAAEDIQSAARLVVLATQNALDAARSETTADSRMVVVDVTARTVEAFVVPRHFACRRCAPRVVAHGDSLRDDIANRWRDDWGQVGSPLALDELGPRLESLVNGEVGMFDRLRSTGPAERRAIWAFFDGRGLRGDETPFMAATLGVAIRPRIWKGRREPVATGGFDFVEPRRAESLALLEGLERLAALDFIAPSRIVRASYADIEATAVDPRAISLLREDQVRGKDSTFRPFDPREESSWVWGVRLITGHPVLVPADVITGDRRSILQTTSSGAACHSSLHHAVLNGLYELIERDALMLTWLNHRSCPLVDVSVNEPDPYDLRAALTRAGLRLTHLDITADVGVPVLMALLEDTHDPDLFMITMVSSLSKARRLDKLYREISQFTHPHFVNRSRYRTAASQTSDPSVVQSLPDHLAFYQDVKKLPLRAFLTESPKRRAFGDLETIESASVDEEVERVAKRLAAAGHDPIAIDCTLPPLRELGLWAVRVVVPGLQPLHVGHARASLANPRVSSTPNPWPHPFW